MVFLEIQQLNKMCILETVELVREKRTCLISDVSALPKLDG